MQTSFDYIIVGQGIAGTTLSYQLRDRGKKVLVVDEDPVTSSSKVAAGMFNPVVFKRLVKSWKADEVLPSANAFYKKAGKLFGKELLHEKEIVKFFTEENERVFWNKKQQEEIGKYLGNVMLSDDFSPFLHHAESWATVRHAGHFQLQEFLVLYRNLLKREERLLEEKFDYDSVQLMNDHVEYKGIKSDRLLFCEGHKTTSNPYFSWLPFKLTKGEVLIVKMQGYITDKVINKGIFILPLGNDLFKVGATYEWEDLSEATSEKGRNTLIEKLEKVLKIPYEIIDQQAGIRPTVKDRRPLIGLHPQHKNLGIFNGLGTKGVLLAPYFADHFIGHIEDEQSLDKEVSIERFHDLFQEI